MVARRRATYEDVLAAPENMIAEVLDGELHLQSRPRRRHLRTASALARVNGAPTKPITGTLPARARETNVIASPT